MNRPISYLSRPIKPGQQCMTVFSRAWPDCRSDPIPLFKAQHRPLRSHTTRGFRNAIEIKASLTLALLMISPLSLRTLVLPTKNSEPGLWYPIAFMIAFTRELSPWQKVKFLSLGQRCRQSGSTERCCLCLRSAYWLAIVIDWKCMVDAAHRPSPFAEDLQSDCSL